jgi:acetyl-CoA carboxylase carboxyl transferase subunit alpha
MLEYSTYSVISPEGCASILWKSADKAKDAAEQMGLTAPRLLENGLIDKIIKEPLGGAHRDPAESAKRIKAAVLSELDALDRLNLPALLDARYARLRRYGSHQAA